MAGLTDATLRSELDHRGTLITHFSLHTADPGATGASEVTGGSPAYARKAAVWAAAATSVLTVTNKALTSNVATLTTSVAHGLQVGDDVIVTGVDSTFNGVRTVTAVPSTTTFSYAVTAANVASVASGGTVTAHILSTSAGTTFDVPGTTTVTHLGYWSALTAGTFRGSRPLSANETFTGQGTYTLAAGAIDETIT